MNAWLPKLRPRPAGYAVAVNRDCGVRRLEELGEQLVPSRAEQEVTKVCQQTAACRAPGSRLVFRMGSIICELFTYAFFP